MVNAYLVIGFEDKNIYNFPQGKFEVYKHKPIRFVKKDRVPETDFKCNIIEIAYATGRTLCSYHLDNKELYFDVLSTLFSHLNFLEINQNGYWVSSESRYNRLRDFSKTARVGELAQAVNYLYTGRVLKFPFIIDYHLVKRRSSVPIIDNGKSPDFVILKRDFSSIGLMESKGKGGKDSGVHGKLGKLGKALVQVNAVSSPFFSPKVPMCVRFENNGDDSKRTKIGNSSINYALIDNICPDGSNDIPLVKWHYASFFYLIGDFGRVESLLNADNIIDLQGDVNYDLDETTMPESPIFWLSDRVIRDLVPNVYLHIQFPFIPHENDGFKIGIFKSVADYLSGGLNELNYVQESNDNYLIIFPDGTIIKRPKKKN